MVGGIVFQSVVGAGRLVGGEAPAVPTDEAPYVVHPRIGIEVAAPDERVMPEQAMEFVRQDVGLPHGAVRGRDLDPIDRVAHHLFGRDLARMEVDAGKPARVGRRARDRWPKK